MLIELWEAWHTHRSKKMLADALDGAINHIETTEQPFSFVDYNAHLFVVVDEVVAGKKFEEAIDTWSRHIFERDKQKIK